MGARFGNLLDDARALYGLAVLQLGLEHRMAGGGHRDLFHRLILLLAAPFVKAAKRNSTPVAGYAVRSLSKGPAENKNGSGFIRHRICLSAQFTAVRNARLGEKFPL